MDSDAGDCGDRCDATPIDLGPLNPEGIVLLADTERNLTALFAAPAWQAAWQRRLKERDRGGTLDNVTRPLRIYLDVAREHLNAGRLDDLRAACADLLDTASGRQWDTTPDPFNEQRKQARPQA